MPKLIEPTYKDKLGISLSYPVGTQLISEVLEGVPQYESLSIHYSKDEGEWLAEYSPTRGLVKLKGDTKDLYPFTIVVTAYYSKPSESWSIVIYRTLSKQNIQVRKFLLNIGLPLIKAWLIEEKSETWYNGFRCLEIGLNKSLDKFGVRETFNDQLINKRVGTFQL